MSDIHKSTRLGDLLIERGTITRQQLRRAIEIQQQRLLNAQQGEDDGSHKELGEILIELGFINRSQLSSGLTWQRKLRKTTMVMAFIAPLLTAACGGSASGSTSQNNTQGNAVSSQAYQSPSSTPKPGTQSSASSRQQSSAPAAVASSSPAKNPSSAAVSSASSSQLAGADTGQSTEVDGPVAIYWSIPTQRENGDELDIREIGGYELRYKLTSTDDFTSIKIDSGYTDAYYFDYLKGEYEFEIATFDVDGLYSRFVSIHPAQ